jgi:hypothetical protein
MRGVFIENYGKTFLNMNLTPPRRRLTWLWPRLPHRLSSRAIPHHGKRIFIVFFMDATRMLIRLWIFIKYSDARRRERGKKNLPIEKIPQSRPGGNPAIFLLIKRHETRGEEEKLSAHKKRSVVCAYSTFL